MEDTIENKETIYGRYEDQAEAISEIIAALNKLKKTVNQKGLDPKEVVDYTLLALKMTRTVTAEGESSVDSWVDLANYSRLICRRRTGVDIRGEFKRIAHSIISKAKTRQAFDEDELVVVETKEESCQDTGENNE